MIARRHVRLRAKLDEKVCESRAPSEPFACRIWACTLRQGMQAASDAWNGEQLIGNRAKAQKCRVCRSQRNKQFMLRLAMPFLWWWSTMALHTREPAPSPSTFPTLTCVGHVVQQVVSSDRTMMMCALSPTSIVGQRNSCMLYTMNIRVRKVLFKPYVTTGVACMGHWGIVVSSIGIRPKWWQQ